LQIMGSNQIQDILTELVHGHNLSDELSERAFHIIMNGGATPAQIAAFLVALRIKGETVGEIVNAAKVMQHKSHGFIAPDDAIDTCGTGGDGKHTLNISTATAIVISACGVKVVKHGNRSVTSVSGSSDVLQHLGVNTEANIEIQQRALLELGFCYLNAPIYHPAMRYVAPIRKELGLRSIFNLLGPLANPARTKRQLLGVYDAKWLRPMAESLHALGLKKAWVVHGDDGMDEITTTTTSRVAELNDGEIKEFQINPEDYGIALCDIAAIKGGLPEDNARAMQELLSGKNNAYRDIVLINAAAGLIVADKCDDIRAGLEMARHAIDSSNAKYLLANYAEMTNY
jgi:anthranilate phosphoribosyltransferase